MRSLMTVCFSALLFVAGCGAYSAQQVPMAEPKDHSYCQRINDMAVGLEPYMVKDKTALVFDGNLRKDEVMAVNIAMLADGSATFKVKRSDITAEDEFGNKYAPMDSTLAAGRLERALRKDKPGLYDDLKAREMPDEVTVTNKLAEHFIYFDMEPNQANSQKFTLYVPATSPDGKRLDFGITIDPMRDQMNPAEKWDSYDGRGVTPCGFVAKQEAPAVTEKETARAEEAAKKAEEAAKRAEEAAKKGEKVFEKTLVK